MSNDDYCLSSSQPVDNLDDRRFCSWVQIRRCFVDNKNLWIAIKRSGDPQSLTLSPR